MDLSEIILVIELHIHFVYLNGTLFDNFKFVYVVSCFLVNFAKFDDNQLSSF